MIVAALALLVLAVGTPARGATLGSPGAASNTAGTTPVVTGVSPDAGPLAGGNTVTISGAGLTGVTAVDFGGVPSPAFNLVSDTAITATAPAGTAGTVDVTVTTNGGTSPISEPADEYVYGPPMVGSVSPSSGLGLQSVLFPPTVTISGTGFTPDSSVSFTGVSFGLCCVSFPSPSVTYLSSTALEATVPTALEALVTTADVIVTTPGGISPTVPGDEFTFIQSATPELFGITPADGPLAGGTPVAIAGLNVTGNVHDTTVFFGSIQVTPTFVFPGPPGLITAVAPAGAGDGPVNVTVSEPDGSQTSALTYTYLSTPSISQVTPASGPIGGGNQVLLTGTGFTGATAVDFGGVAASSMLLEGDTTIEATVPAASSAQQVQVTVTRGQVTSAAGPTYTYAPAAGTPTPTPTPTPTTTTTTPGTGTGAPPAPAAGTTRPAPTIVTVRAGAVGTIRTVVSALVDTGGEAVSACTFQVGTSITYGRIVGCSAPVATSSTLVSITGTLAGLSPNTRYHARLEITTEGGTTGSSDLAFTTAQLPAISAPLVGLLVQPATGPAGAIGQLLGLQGVQKAVRGERIALSCEHGCPSKVLATLPSIKPPFAKVHLRLAHAVTITKATRIGILVTKPGELGRFATYAFAVKGHGLTVRVVQTGCISTTGRQATCQSLHVAGS